MCEAHPLLCEGLGTTLSPQKILEFGTSRDSTSLAVQILVWQILGLLDLFGISAREQLLNTLMSAETK